MPERQLRIVTFLAPNMLPVYERTMQFMGDKLGFQIELVTGERYEQAFEADLSLICGLPYVLRTSPHLDSSPLTAIIAPVLYGERYQDRPIYFSDVIVHRDSPFQSFDDLRGKSWAFNEPESQSGYGITRYTLVSRGETNGYFGNVIEAGFHQRAVRMVANGEADASAIDSQVLSVELRENPDLANRVRIIDTLGPSTIQPIAANVQRLTDDLIEDIRNIFTQMHLDPDVKDWLNWGYIERFVAVSDTDYDDIRDMLAVCEQAGFLTLR